jgi:hypothetical protein
VSQPIHVPSKIKDNTNESTTQSYNRCSLASTGSIPFSTHQKDIQKKNTYCYRFIKVMLSAIDGFQLIVAPGYDRKSLCERESQKFRPSLGIFQVLRQKGRFVNSYIKKSSTYQFNG